MATTESINIPAHHNIYNGINKRDLRIDFAIPDKGTNSETGIFVFVPGFGGHIDSNVYKKMREQFADQYNVVTVQCDYFGSLFMQTAENFNLKDGFDSLTTVLSEDDMQEIKYNPKSFLSIVSNYSITIPAVAVLGETKDEFVDMGYMQAIDVVTAIEAIKIILTENQLPFNEGRVIGYGQSQGAYLLHLANKLAPHLFSQIIDNAAWVEPVYLRSNRFLYQSFGKATIVIEFDYIVKQLLQDKKALSLHSLYKRFKNGAYIYSCIGTTDNLVDVQDKRKSLSGVNNVAFEIIDSTKVDGVIFKSTNHGLDADFLELVDYVLAKKPTHINKNKKMMQYYVASSQTRLNVDYSNGLPVFQFVD